MNAYYSNKFYNLKYNFDKLFKVILIGVLIYIISIPMNSFPILVSVPLKLLTVFLFPLIIYSLGIITAGERRNIFSVS